MIYLMYLENQGEMLSTKIFLKVEKKHQAFEHNVNLCTPK